MFSIIMSLFTKRTKATSNLWFAPKRGKTKRFSILSSRFDAFDPYLKKACGGTLEQ